MGHTPKHGGLLRDILEGEVGKKRGRPRLEYFEQITRDMGSKTFREVKEPSGDGWLCQTSLRTVYSMIMRARIMCAS